MKKFEIPIMWNQKKSKKHNTYKFETLLRKQGYRIFIIPEIGRNVMITLKS